MSKSVSRVTISLESEVAASLRFSSLALGVSTSSLVNEILRGELPAVDSLPDVDSVNISARSRSPDVVRARIQELKQGALAFK